MARYSPVSFEWPLEAFPNIDHGNRFPMDRKTYSIPSCSPRTVAIHQHEYKGEFRLGNRRFTLRPGDVTITPVGIPFSYQLPQDGEHLCVHFHPIRSARKTVALPLHVHLGLEAHFVREKLNSIISLFRGASRPGLPGQLARQVSSATLQELLLWLAWHHEQKRTSPLTSKAQNALDQLLHILDSRLGQVLSVPKLAEEVGLSQDYLAKIFHSAMGVTIPRYLLHRRIDVARHLLQSTQEPVHVIAARVGIPDAQYFNKQFRRFTGTSPTALR